MEEDDAMDCMVGATWDLNKGLAARSRGIRSEIIKTPLGMRQLGEWSGEREFSGFKEEKVTMRRIIIMDRELKAGKEMVAAMFEKQDQLIAENLELRERCLNLESTVKVNHEMKNTLEEIKRENSALKGKCTNYEAALQGLQEKLDSNLETGKEMSERKLDEWKKIWKKEREEEKVFFAEVVKQQIKVIKEKEELVRDMVDKRMCIVIYGLEEKKNPVKFVREEDEKEMVKEIISVVQDKEQSLDKETEEIYELGKYSEGTKRPQKVKMRLQIEILARTRKLAEKAEYKHIWIKREMNQVEREKERELRSEAKEKSEGRTENEKKFYWRVLDMRLRKWYIWEGEGKHLESCTCIQT
ncbi:hypothetical protein E2C01_072365 [Portunus trituberculatus]|uniref:Uncharacterized protein n=1 Tax=Portunus trituberculatus TaxID=210409 RepID=A0A5B7I7I6_PORTR|nr:hypothetical protein [Portunus trituberculatus]